VIWSGESKFQLFGSEGRQYYWEILEEQLNDRHIKPTVKHGGGNIMVWVVWLHMESVSLQESIVASIKSYTSEFLVVNWWTLLNGMVWRDRWAIFSMIMIPNIQPNQPRNGSLRVTSEFAEWPAQSPDLNPIGHIWDEVDRRVGNLPNLPRNCEGLWEKRPGRLEPDRDGSLH